MTLKRLTELFSIIPLRLPPENHKAPAISDWTDYQNKKYDYTKLVEHEQKGGGFGVVCGYDNLQVIDIDNHFGDADQLYQFVIDNFDKELLTIKTGGGGYHLYFKCKTIEGNKKLAQRINDKGKAETLIETRAKGGQVVFYDNIIRGDIDYVSYISESERMQLLTICKALNEVNRKEKSDEKPGDAYLNDPSAIHETYSLLQQNGWTSKDMLHWKRPDKNTPGISATFGKVGKNKFYVFSSNAYPFESDTSYSMMGVRALLLHNGDYTECAKELAAKYDIKPKPSDKQKEEKKKPKAWTVLEEIIKNWKLEFRYNELTKVVDYRKDKGEYQQLKLLPGDLIYEMERNKGVKISATKLKEMISNSTICKSYNPIRKFFSLLPKYDGQNTIEKLCKYIETDEDPIYFYEMIKKHLIRTIRCALEPNYVNRIVLTFHGEQEIGKSKIFQWLFSFYRELYTEEPVNPTDKDSILMSARYLLCNLDDIDELNKKEIGKLKAFIAKSKITKRVAYGHYDEHFDRIVSFVATTNQTNFLSDDKNTRWVILNVLSFNWQKYTKEVDPRQIWAEAYHFYKENNESGELTTDEKQIRDQKNDNKYLVITSEREILELYFKKSEERKMTATDAKLLIERNLYPMKISLYNLQRELKRLFGAPIHTTYRNKGGKYYDIEANFPIQNANTMAIQSTVYESHDAPKQIDLPF